MRFRCPGCRALTTINPASLSRTCLPRCAECHRQLGDEDRVREVTSIDYFNASDPGHNQLRLRDPVAVQAIIAGMAAVAGGMVTGLYDWTPLVRQLAAFGAGAMALLAVGLGIRALRRSTQAYVDHSLSIFAIGLGLLSLVAAVCLFVPRRG